MTAEIAVMNRTAVALAADSATTLVSGRGTKVNNNADKLFHLCDAEPVGAMIFGNGEFMATPFEPIMKGFRASSYSSPKDDLEAYTEAFFEFLESSRSTKTRSPSTSERS